MAKQRKPPRVVARPETEVLTRGYDPRLSVGIENWRDLIQEYTAALDAL